MATFIFDGSQSLRIESFDVANDRLIVDFTADEVVSVENVQGSASLTLANGTSLVFVGLTYADLAEADILPDDLLIIASDENQQPGGNPVFNGALNGAIVAALGGSVAVANDGDDVVVGLTGDDLLLGNMGDDLVFGGGGNDRLYGGMGDDLILAGQDFDGDLEGAFEDGGLETSSDVELFVAGGLGQDTILVGGGLELPATDDGLVSGSVTVYGGDSNADPADEADLIAVGLADNATALVTGNGGDDVIGIYGEGSATVYGGQGDDLIYAQVESGVFFGNLGEDTITVFASQGATVYGGQNDDVIDANFGGDSLIFGNLGDDEISLNENEDSDLDDIGSATVYGGQGNDTITGFLGDGSAVYGGAGADEIDVSIVDGDVTVIGGNGGDNAGDRDDLIIVGLYGEGNQSAFVTGNLGDDEILLQGAGTFTVYGGQGDDLITTNFEGSGESRGLGDDSAIYGGRGEDTLDLYVGGNNVSIFGGSGLGDTADQADTITVYATRDVQDLAIYGNGGNDTIVLSGGGEVSVFGGVGNDTIGFGGDAFGDYTLTGGTGADLFDLTNATGDALIDIDISLNGSDAGATIRIADFDAEDDQIAIGQTLVDANVLDLVNATVTGGELIDGLLGLVSSTLEGTLDAVFSLAARDATDGNLAVTFEFGGQEYLAIGTVEGTSTAIGGLLSGAGKLLGDLGLSSISDANVTALINITGYTGTIDADVFTA